MKQWLFVFFTLIISSLMAQKTDIPFRANWQFKGLDTLDFMYAHVPGCVHTDLVRAQIIPDPLTGINETLCQWIGEKDWVYETLPFDTPEEIFAKEIIRLKFHQLDTYATVYLNNHKLLETENAFRAYEADVKDHLKRSGNVLRVVFESPVKTGQKRIGELGYPLPGDAMRAVTRKPQYHYGWDWGPKLITSGITGPVEWVAYDSFRFEDIYIEQKFVTEERAEVVAHMTLHAHQRGDLALEVMVRETGEYSLENIEIRPGTHTYYLSVSIKNPRLWWSNGAGHAALYHFDIALKSENERILESTVRTGLRSVRLLTEKDLWGESFYFELNGKPIFAKGANFIPVTMLPATATRHDYLQLLQLCRDHHFNMLRVWGGGYYEHRDFYEICDSLGIMVWQDFMFACSMYPGNDRFLRNVEAEAEYQTKRLRNHPSIVLWCGNNENAEGWERWGWQTGLKDREKSRLKKAYDELFGTILPEIVFKNHAQVNYWESSPRYGRGDKRSFTEGDAHYWGLWHDEEPFEWLNERVPRFMSEFGMQSYPNAAALSEIITPGPLTDNAGLAQHQKHPRGRKLMDDYLRRWYTPEFIEKQTIEGYGKLTQSMQAEGMLMGIEAHRRNKPYCMGTLFWQLNDVWPAFSWSAVDYKMQPKIFMDALKTAYAPRLISPVLEDEFLRICFINDGEPLHDIVDVEVEIYHVITGDKTEDKATFISLEKEGIIYSRKWDELFPGKGAEDYLIHVRLMALDGSLVMERVQKIVGKTYTGLHLESIDNKLVWIHDK